MQPPYEPAVRGRSALASAFLSLLFPGLGHVYLGAYKRGLGWAAPPILLAAFAAGVVVRSDPLKLAGLAVQDWFLTAVFVANVLVLGYRLVAIVDAWRIARWLSRPTPSAGSSTRSAARTAPPMRSGGAAAALAALPVAGLLAVMVVASGVHVVVARYDLLVARTAACIFDTTGSCSPDSSGAPAATDAGGDLPSSAATEGPVDTSGPAAVPPWNGTDRLNVLLLGADEQNGGHNTDTMIVVSVDPGTRQAVMFQVPRDTVDVPLPPGKLRNIWGLTYGGKINSFYAATAHRRDLPDSLKGYNGLMAVLGNLYGLDINYYVEVNFLGFKRIVDALGGVTVDVQVPVSDDHYPAAGGNLQRLYIPAGMQVMDGATALQYARSRHSTSDFDRAARQQRILVSLRRQVDIATLLPQIDTLANAVGQSLRTNIPRDMLPQLLGLAQQVDTKAITSLIFTPPYYGTESTGGPLGYTIICNPARVRQGVQQAISSDPGFVDRQQAVAGEGAVVWVLNGSGLPGEGARLAAYLEYLGLAATAPNQKAPATGSATTVVRAYNGAETADPLTTKLLQDTFGVVVVPIADPTVDADFVVITARKTPDLTPPPLP